MLIVFRIGKENLNRKNRSTKVEYQKNLINRQMRLAQIPGPEIFKEAFNKFLKEFIKMSPQFNYSCIRFTDFDLLIDQDKLIELATPGLFGIHCFKKNKTLLMKSYHLLSSLVHNYDDLEDNLFEPSRQLRKDYQRFGPENFAFVIITFGPEFENLKRLDKNFLALKQSWPFELYASKYF